MRNSNVVLKIIVIFIFNLIYLNYDITSHAYKGEYFSKKYLVLDKDNVSWDDVDYYLAHLVSTLNYFSQTLNETDVNIAVGSFLTTAVLKTTQIEANNSLRTYQTYNLKKTIYALENIVSHYVYKHKDSYWGDVEFRVSLLFKDYKPVIYTMGQFNSGRLSHWVFDKNNISEFVKDMDKTTMPKELYVQQVDRTGVFYLDLQDSDHCITQIPYMAHPNDLLKMKRCDPDKYCEERMSLDPSVGYFLSHRYLNYYFRYALKRCYLYSEEEDMMIMHRLCANMYRESVYIAKRGFFARDLFLEHIALCGMLGYEEFLRIKWFKKAVTWYKKEGCILEDNNYTFNRSVQLLARAGNNTKNRMQYGQFICNLKSDDCHNHPTALVMVVLSHAIRYTTHLMKSLL